MDFTPKAGSTDGTFAKTSHATEGTTMGFSFKPASGKVSTGGNAIKKTLKRKEQGKSMQSRSSKLGGYKASGAKKLKG